MAELPGAVYRSDPWSGFDALYCAILISTVLLWFVEKIRAAFILLLTCSIIYVGILMVEEHPHHHLWKYYRYGTTLYSLECNDSTVHFISNRLKAYELNRFKQNCELYYDNKQVYKMIDAAHFMLDIKNKLYVDTAQQNAFHSSHYERVCL